MTNENKTSPIISMLLLDFIFLVALTTNIIYLFTFLIPLLLMYVKVRRSSLSLWPL